MSYPPLPSNGETQWGDKFRTWADALEGRKVEGNGLSLRRDTSVGERLYLDYPGGTTMLHGDTGWRNIADLVSPDLQLHTIGGFLRLRRNQGTAQISGRLQVRPGSTIIGTPRTTRVLICVLPTGFAPQSQDLPTPSSARIGTSTPGSVFSISPRRLELMGQGGNWTSGEDVLFSATVPVYITWPTTLPGIPV